MIVLFRLLSFLPLSWLHALGAFCGVLTWLFSPAYRRHLRANMRLALGADGERQLRWKAIFQAGKTSLELPRIWLRPQPEAAALVREVRGAALLEAATREGKGIIFITAHLGCFEVVGQYLALTAPLTALYRPPKKRWLQRLIETGRGREQLHLAATDLGGVRKLRKALKNREAVILLPDQAPRVGEGRWLDFFGRPAYTMTLAARLSESGAPLVMVWAERLSGGAGYRLHLQRPTQEIHGSVDERAQQINRQIEAMIRQCPSQYLWAYNRYKRPRGAEAPPERS